MAGGPSHIDTFDPKPDAPSDVKGEFKPIDTAVPGLKISEVFPNLAKVMDRVTLVRSVTSPEADHDRAAHHLLTGYRPSPALVYPSFGSVVSKTLEDTRGALPPYVAMPDAPIFASSGYLTPAYDPFAAGGDPNTRRVPGPRTSPRPTRSRSTGSTVDGGWSRRSTASATTSPRRRWSPAATSSPTGLMTCSPRRRPRPRSGSATRRTEMRQAYGRTTVRPVLPAGPSAGPGGRLVRDDQQPRGRAAPVGHPRPELPLDQDQPRAAARPRPLDLARRPEAAWAARRDPGDCNGRIRPDTQDQPDGGPRPPRPGQLRVARRVRASRRERSSARPTPRETRRSTGPSRRPTSPRRSTPRSGSTPTINSRPPTAARSGWSTGQDRCPSCSRVEVCRESGSLRR